MPAEIAVIKTIIDLVASEAVLKGAKALWAKMPWAKDAKKVDAVERMIDGLVADAARLARVLPSEAMAPEIQRLSARFSTDLMNIGIPADEAKVLTETIRSQILATVVEPIEDLRRVHKRLEALEAENLEQKRFIDRLVHDSTRSARAVRNLEITVSICLVLSVVSLGLWVLGQFHR